MASPSLLLAPGNSGDIYSGQNNVLSYTRGMAITSGSQKKGRDCITQDSLLCESSGELKDSLPTLVSPDYFMKPCLNELIERELLDPGYCSRVPDFIVGKIGYGYVKFLGETDVRGLNLDPIVKFQKNAVVVYEDESSKPVVGEGLNKPAEVTLIIRIANSGLVEERADNIVEKLKLSTERQGATFISFDPSNGFWKFLVPHFSRFGLSDDDEDDIVMDDATGAQDIMEMHNGRISDNDEEPQVNYLEPELSHSLPAHLGLDPAKMKEMRMVMFATQEGDEDEGFRGISSRKSFSATKRHARPSLQEVAQKNSHRDTPPVTRKTPLALLEYNPGSSDKTSSGNILMAHENKGLPLKKLKTKGFELDISQVTPLTGNYSRNIVDAALFMGRSFRAGWGPNGLLLHTGTPVGSSSSQRILSSVINIEKIAIDKVVRDENEKVKKELVELAFEAPLNLHKELDHEIEEAEVGSFKLRLYKVVTDRIALSDICRSYIDKIETQLEVPGLSASSRLIMMHQVMVWELIKVLFSERENSGPPKSLSSDNEENMIEDIKEAAVEIDPDALPLVRRAEFSCWLQESVGHRVQEDVSSLNESQYLEHLFFLLTGRQLDSAVELATSKGDVRLACLLSQAGGSSVNRTDVAQQLDVWRCKGLDFNFVEKERVKLYELLSGNILGALHDTAIDWKRFLGLLMWYHLPPDMSLPQIFQHYQHLLNEGEAPSPVPIYIDEAPMTDFVDYRNNKQFDLSYYLMLLHSSQERDFSLLKTMFSAFSSTDDPLDYHMIWHQRGVLDAIGAISSDDLQVLDMGFVSQLLSQGQCHWAIYVVLHIRSSEGSPYIQANVVREILYQYCETWSSEESQRQFIEDLGVPSEWMHEALAVYYDYFGDSSKALEHFLKSASWQRGHSIFVTSVAHSLFLEANHSETWRLATSMEDHKSEIENWDLGAGIYISFYLLKGSLQEDSNTMGELDSVESKNDACKDFIGRINESIAVYGDKLPVGARVAYSKMVEEICDLLLSDLSEAPTRDVQLSCFETVFNAPVPEDLRSAHLQDAVSLFSLFLGETSQTVG